MEGIRMLTSPAPDVEAFLKLFHGLSIVPAEPDDAHERNMKVLGVTYGDLANDLWDRIVKRA
jgi:hypothetical protein